MIYADDNIQQLTLHSLTGPKSHIFFFKFGKNGKFLCALNLLHSKAEYDVCVHKFDFGGAEKNRQ